MPSLHNSETAIIYGSRIIWEQGSPRETINNAIIVVRKITIMLGVPAYVCVENKSSDNILDQTVNNNNNLDVLYPHYTDGIKYILVTVVQTAVI